MRKFFWDGPVMNKGWLGDVMRGVERTRSGLLFKERELVNNLLHYIPPMQVARENLDAAIETLLTYVPEPLQHDPNYKPEKVIFRPLEFYDRHVDDQLSLKRIAPFPYLLANLSQTVDRVIRKLKDDGVVFPTSNSSILVRKDAKIKHVGDAQAVGNAYKMNIAEPSVTLASMFSLHPKAPWWASSIDFDKFEPSHERYRGNDPLDESSAPSFRFAPEDKNTVPPAKAWCTMDKYQWEIFDEARESFSQLATFHFYYGSDQVEGGMRKMDDYIRQPMDSTCGTVAPLRVKDDVRPFRPDAADVVLKAPTASSRRSRRIASRTRTSLRQKTLSEHAVIPACGQEPDISKSMLLHAWSRAVEDDTTFIVIHCGNFERIGFRHRESQTLFLSELIDIPRCTEPPYSKIHLGLYISIIEDVMDRARQIMEKKEQMKRDLAAAAPQEPTGSKRKRKHDEVDVSRSSKRPRTRACAANDLAKAQNLEATIKEIKNRHLALVRVQYLHYNSPVPATFWDDEGPCKRVHRPHEYITITLTKTLGDGSTGHAHRAVLELIMRNGERRVLSDVVVKLATDYPALCRLRRENSNYKHLEASGVKEIPRVLGHYSDLNANYAILIMTSVGEGLWNRPLQKGGTVQISPSEREGFIEVLKSIHAAGVRHRDVRVPNMAVKDDGSVSIFDFDMADLCASEESRTREMEHLIALLDGEVLPYAPQRTLGTPDRSHDDYMDAVEHHVVDGLVFDLEEPVKTQPRR